MARFAKARPGRLNQSRTHSAPPMIGIDIERAEFSVLRQIGIARRRSCCESYNRPVVDSHERPRLARIAVGKVVSLCAVLRAKLIQVVFGQQRAIRMLPRSNMHLRYSKSVVWLGTANLHFPSIAWRRSKPPYAACRTPFIDVVIVLDVNL